MLIHIDSAAVEVLVRGGPSSDKTLRCVENLLQAHGNCKHIISLLIQDITKLQPLSGRFSESGRAALANILSRRREISGFRKQIAYYLEVGPGMMANQHVCAGTGQQVLRGDIHHFEDSEWAGRSVLLAENLTDAEFYRTLGRVFATAKGWQANIAYELRGGGGSTIAESFAQIVQDGRIALAIADSDRRHPKGGLGSTAAALVKVDAKQDFQSSHVLHVRAAENLVPFKVYEEALAPHKTTPSIPGLLEALDRAVTGSNRKWRAHANLKTGLLWREVEQMAIGDEGKFWSSVSCEAKRDRCRDATRCRAAGECTCAVVEGLGKEALASTVRWIRTQRSERLAKLLDSADDPQLQALCEKLASWGCASPSRVRA